MGSISSLPHLAGVTVADAVGAYRLALRQSDTSRGKGTTGQYATALRLLADAYGAEELATLDPGQVAEWFGQQPWATANSASPWNTARAALHKLAGFAMDQAWVDVSPFGRIPRRDPGKRRNRDLPRADVFALLTDRRVPLREKVLYAVLYDSGHRISEVLDVNIEDLDRVRRRAPVRTKGGDIEFVTWSAETANNLGRLIRGRSRGPLFATNIASRTVRAPRDMTEDGRGRLGYLIAEQTFKRHCREILGYPETGCPTIHQLKHSRVSHLWADGASLEEISVRTGNSPRTLADGYARMSLDDVQARTDRIDPFATLRH